jgi:hypothetical protein
MRTLEMLEVFGYWFWEFATDAQLQELQDHLNEVAYYTACREQHEEIQYCESLANPV